MVVKLNIVGTMINQLFVLERLPRRMYKCRCNQCGRESIYTAKALRNKTAKCLCSLTNKG